MANTEIRIKHSTIAGNVPVQLANGEIAINTYDGKIFYAAPNGAIKFISTEAGPSGLNGEIQFNDSGTLGASANLSFDKTTNKLTVGGEVQGTVLRANQSSGDEGGQIDLNKPETNTTINVGIAIDVYQDKLRIFETGGTNRGVFINIANTSTGVGTDLLAQGQGASGFSGFSGYSGQDGASGISGYSGQDGASGISGFSGYSGEQGISGFSGYSGEKGTSGFSGYSGEKGDSGISGYSGEQGESGISGYSGQDGASGFSGYSGEKGESGFSGYSGQDGTSGFSGQDGLSGFSGYSGEQGTSGFSGYSGEKGDSGFSGYSGQDGTSGFSGYSGEKGDSGISGYSGQDGLSGFSGYSGQDGLSGFSGEKGDSGFSGYSGEKGDSGFSGYSGEKGDSGFSGYSGQGGTSGFSGFSGYSGRDGQFGGASFYYIFDTKTDTVDPGQGRLNVNSASFSTSTTLTIHDNDRFDTNIASFLQTIDDSTSDVKGYVKITEESNTINFVIFAVVGVHTEQDQHFDIPISYVSGVTTPFGNSTNVITTFTVTGDKGDQGLSGFSGYSGTSGYSGQDGTSGISGFSGYSGQDGLSGFSGYSGQDGESGISGFSGEQGISGISGYSGEKGDSGFSGYSGQNGTSGFSGYSGQNGTSGFSGYSGEKGDSGISGYSGQNGTSGFSGQNGLSGFSGYSGQQGISGFSGYSGTALFNAVRKTTTYTAVSGDILIADTSGGSFAITLPANPSSGNRVAIYDGHDWSANNLTVARNGQTIEGLSENLLLDISNIFVDFVFDGTTWEVYASVGVPGQQGISGYSGEQGLSGFSGYSGAIGNNFSTISVTGQSDLIANTIDMTLTIVPGANVTITTAPETNTLTIDSVGGGGTATGDVSPTPDTVVQRDSNGDAYANNFISSSDIRLKSDIEKIENSLELLNRLNGVTFKWTGNENKSYGFIAQEVEKVLPELVSTSDNGYKGVLYTPVIAILLEAIKDLQRQIDELKK